MRRPALAAVAALALSALAAPVHAASTGQLRPIKVDPSNSNNRIYNYDFNSQKLSRRNVDWGLDLVFYNNAEVDKIKDSLGYSNVGSRQNGRLNNGKGWFWDQDGGRKNFPCSFATFTNHYRVYADQAGGDRNYSPGLGFYVVGSTHRDVNECGGGTRVFGYSELAENDIAALATGLTDWQVYRNVYDMRNREPLRREGDHRWHSNGLATMFRIPS
jgi:hypothetical protein